jgi:hypothetical protein
MLSGPDRHRVVPTRGDDSKNGRARCPSQPSPGTCAQPRSPSSSRCPQRRSAAGRRRACCPTSGPWAATDATPTPRSGPCGQPCPSHPRPASRGSRLTAPGSLLSVASVVVGDRPPLDRDRVGPGTGDSVGARANRPLALAWRVRSRRPAELESCGHGCPLLSEAFRSATARSQPQRGLGRRAHDRAGQAVQPANDQQLVDELALSPQEDRRPWSAPAATPAHGGGGESSVPGPTLCGDSSTGQGCTGRAGWRSRPQRRCGRCQSFGVAARRSGRGVFPPSAPSCLERPLGRASQTLPGLPRPKAVATGRLLEGL